MAFVGDFEAVNSLNDMDALPPTCSPRTRRWPARLPIEPRRENRTTSREQNHVERTPSSSCAEDGVPSLRGRHAESRRAASVSSMSLQVPTFAKTFARFL